MKHTISKQIVPSVLVLASLLLAPPISAQVINSTVKINGMIWGLWARGAQKALQRLDGVDHAEVDLVKGEGQVFPKAGKSFDPDLIPKAIQGAGFTPVGVVVTAEGTLLKSQELVVLQVPGLNHRFVLEGGTQPGTLKERTDLLGKRIRVTGTLHPSHGDLPPGLTVERFQPAQ